MQEMHLFFSKFSGACPQTPLLAGRCGCAPTQGQTLCRLPPNVYPSSYAHGAGARVYIAGSMDVDSKGKVVIHRAVNKASGPL